jgi:hypothetical protein
MCINPGEALGEGEYGEDVNFAFLGNNRPPANNNERGSNSNERQQGSRKRRHNDGPGTSASPTTPAAPMPPTPALPATATTAERVKAWRRYVQDHKQLFLDRDLCFKCGGPHRRSTCDGKGFGMQMLGFTLSDAANVPLDN